MRRVVGAFAALLGLALLVPATPAVSAAPGELTGFQYVALGDSYSAGFGLLPFSATSPFSAKPPATENGCYQANLNYPHQVATQFGLAIDDQTCSGAISANLGYPTGTTITPPPVVNTLPTLPSVSEVQTTMTNQLAPQLQTAALSPATDIVTFAIGGNDLGFADIAEACIRLSNSAGSYVTGLQILASISVHNCKEYFDDQATYPNSYLRDRFSTYVVPRINAVLNEIALAAPNAQVFVVGYPQIATADAAKAAACWTNPLPPSVNAVPFSETDILFIHEIEGLIDAALETGATDRGFHFVSSAASTAAHTLCETDPWINGLSIIVANSTPPHCPADYQPLGYDGNVYACVELGALHPDESGINNLAALVAPAVNAAFGTSLSTSSVEPGGGLTVTGLGFHPGEQVEVVLNSTPVTLGMFTAGPNGAFTAAVTVPANVAPGAHTIVAAGQGSSRTFSAALTVELAASGSAAGPLASAALPLLGLTLLAAGLLLTTLRTPRRTPTRR